MSDIKSKLLTKIKDDIEAKKIVFKDKASKVEAKVLKEIKSKLSSKIEGDITVEIRGSFNYGGYRIHLYAGGSSMCVISKNFGINTGVSCSFSEDTDMKGFNKITIISFFADQVKNKKSSYKKIKRFMEPLYKIQDEIDELLEKAREERRRLRKELEDKKMEILKDFIKPGNSFILNPGEINRKTFKSRGGYPSKDGVLLEIVEPVKRSLKVKITGRKRVGRCFWDKKDRVYEYKISPDRLLKLVCENIKKGDNPSFERAMKISELL